MIPAWGDYIDESKSDQSVVKVSFWYISYNVYYSWFNFQRFLMRKKEMKLPNIEKLVNK